MVPLCIEGREKITVIAHQSGTNISAVPKWAKDHRQAQSHPADWPGIVEAVGVARPLSGRAQSNPGLFCDRLLVDMRLPVDQTDSFFYRFHQWLGSISCPA